jgi:hypothetical protein
MTNQTLRVAKKLTAKEILEQNDLDTVDVEVPEWGGVITLRSLSAGEAMGFIDQFQKNPKESALELLIASAVDAEGDPLFRKEDLEALKAKGLKAILRLQTAAMELNGLADFAAARAEAKNA